MSNELQTEEAELSTEIKEEKNEHLKAQVHVLLHIWKFNFLAWKLISDIHRRSGVQPISSNGTCHTD